MTINSKYLFLYILPLLSWWCLGVCQSNPPFNYYVFALEHNGGTNWKIHGLWPEYTPTTWPQFCQPSRYGEYNHDTIQTHYPSIGNYWPDSQWKHEWMKHGTCTNMTMLQYFGRTYDIFQISKNHKFYSCCSKNKCSLNIDLKFNLINCKMESK